MAAWVLSQCTAASYSIHRAMVKCIFTVPHTWCFLALAGKTSTDPNVTRHTRCPVIYETRKVPGFPLPAPSTMYGFFFFTIIYLSDGRSVGIPIQEEQIDSNSSLIKNWLHIMLPFPAFLSRSTVTSNVTAHSVALYVGVCNFNCTSVPLGLIQRPLWH